MTITYTLPWNQADAQGTVEMGSEYPTPDAAWAAVPEAELS